MWFVSQSLEKPFLVFDGIVSVFWLGYIRQMELQRHFQAQLWMPFSMISFNLWSSIERLTSLFPEGLTLRDNLSEQFTKSLTHAHYAVWRVGQQRDPSTSAGPSPWLKYYSRSFPSVALLSPPSIAMWSLGDPSFVFLLVSSSRQSWWRRLLGGWHGQSTSSAFSSVHRRLHVIAVISAITCAILPCSYIVLTFQKPISVVVLALTAPIIMAVASSWLWPLPVMRILL